MVMSTKSPDPVPDWDAVHEIRTRRNILMIMPKFPMTFWGLDYSFADIISGPRYPLPPLSLTTVAAFLPSCWNVTIVDENVRPVTGLEWKRADAIMVNAMIVQTESVQRLTRHAHRLNKPIIVGGPNPSIAPDHYPEADYIHQGEIGDATIQLLQDLARDAGRPERQKIYKVTNKVPLTAYPPPRHDLIRSRDYLSMSLQFAVGCPFNCEFCDIIEIYGRNPRVKQPEQVLGELDRIRSTGHRGSVFFVDDNFIGNIPRVKALLPHIVRWQAAHGHPFQFYTESSVNLAEHATLLDDMRQAGFYAVFLGIETPDPGDLKLLQKSQNARRPLMESIRIIQSHGLEIWAGFILGLDTDKPDTGKRMAEFIEESAITMAMVNLLNAPVGTQLWRRLQAEGRLLNKAPIGDNVTDTNMLYKMGQATTFKIFRDVWNRLYEPRAYLERIRKNIELTGAGAGRLGDLVPLAVRIRSFPRMVWHMGIRAPYRRDFWKLLTWCVRRGAFDAFTFQIAMAYHCIRFRDRVLSARPELELEPETAAIPSAHALA